MNRGADWLAWALHFVFGLVIGFVVALGVLLGRGRGIQRWHLEPEAIPFILIGLPLLAAGVSSFFGDRLWSGDSYRVIPPDEMQHDGRSRAASGIAGAVGAFLLMIALLRQFEVF